MANYSKPEKLVETDVMCWLKSNGFSCHVVESKAVYSKAAGRYLRGMAARGFLDIVGNDKLGAACFIELKAKGKRSTLRPAQHEFIIDKICTNAFAVVVDSAELLSSYYEKWNHLRFKDSAMAQEYLQSIIPHSKKKRANPLDAFEV